MTEIKLNTDNQQKYVNVSNNFKNNNNVEIIKEDDNFDHEDTFQKTDDNLLFDYITNKDKYKDEDDEGVDNEETNYSESDGDEETNGVRHPENGFYNENMIRREKAYLLFQLRKLTGKGYNLSGHFDMESSLDDLKDEVTRIKKEMEIEKSIRLARQGLTLITSLIETANNKYDPLSVDLNGWSESVHANIEDYDEVFEELYEKYNTSISMSPEIKLLLMISGSALSFHISKKMLGGGMSGPDIMDTLSGAMGGGKKGGDMKGPSDSNVADILEKMKKNDIPVAIVDSSDEESNGSVKDVPINQPKKRGRKPNNKKVLDL